MAVAGNVLREGVTGTVMAGTLLVLTWSNIEDLISFIEGRQKKQLCD